jgi:hypothetical protein
MVIKRIAVVEARFSEGIFLCFNISLLEWKRLVSCRTVFGMPVAGRRKWLGSLTVSMPVNSSAFQDNKTEMACLVVDWRVILLHADFHQ